jgi:hypothetical protein
MRMEITGTVVDGALELDQRLDMPDQSLVRVALEPVEDWRARARAGLEAWKAYCDEHPIYSGGRRYTRDELHERR